MHLEALPHKPLKNRKLWNPADRYHLVQLAEMWTHVQWSNAKRRPEPVQKNKPGGQHWLRCVWEPCQRACAHAAERHLLACAAHGKESESLPMLA
jgi:hypothetical protein